MLQNSVYPGEREQSAGDLLGEPVLEHHAGEPSGTLTSKQILGSWAGLNQPGLGLCPSLVTQQFWLETAVSEQALTLS